MQPNQGIDLSQLKAIREIQTQLSEVKYFDVKAGDRVIVCMPGTAPAELIQNLANALKQLHPDVQWTVVAGVTNIIHERATLIPLNVEDAADIKDPQGGMSPEATL